jgi:hypothetical protein
MDKEQLGSMWYECTEPFTLAIRAFGESDLDLRRELYRAVDINDEALWRNMPRTFGQPVDALYTYTPPSSAPGQPLGLEESKEEEEEEDEELTEDETLKGDGMD